MNLNDLYCVNENVNLDDYLNLYKYVKNNMKNPNWLGEFTKKKLKKF